MKIAANQTNTRNDPGLQSALREQQGTTLAPSRRPLPAKTQAAASSSEQQGTSSQNRAYSSTFSRNSGAYVQAIRAYQEAARFEENGGGSAAIGNVFGRDATGNDEKALTNFLREEPTNSAAWGDLGLLYHGQGDRDKVSAIYQILKEIDTTKADAFATQVGLNEKMLFNVA